MLKRLLLIVFACLLVACGSAQTPEETPAETAAPTAVPEAVEVDESAETESAEVEEEAVEEVADVSVEAMLSDMSWDEIIAQAQEEGELSWFQWYFQPRFREVVTAFEEEYGITVTIADGALDANMNKLIAESGREQGDIDVLSTTFGNMSKLDIASMFVNLEQVPDIAKLTTAFEGVDTEGHGIAWWGNQTGFAYDTNRVDASDLPQTFEELTAWMEANPQQFAVNDPNGGGSGPAFVAATIRNFAGENDYHDEEIDDSKVADWNKAWEWFEAQADNYVITSSNADSLTRLNDGEFLLVPAWEDHLAGLQKEGAISADIGFYIPEFGMNGGANAITIPANAQNKAAALLFVQWITSAETQSQLNVTFGSSPKHPDASDEFALVSNDQRAFSTRWFTQPYGELASETFINRVILGNEVAAETESDDSAETAMFAEGLEGMSWDEIVAQAQEEGELNWFQWYFQPRFREFVVAFEEEFGIKVTIADGALDANMNKLIAESGREEGDIDVLSTTFGNMSKLEIASMFTPLSQVEDIDILTTVFEGVDTEEHGIAWWGNQTGFAYDTNRVDVDDLPQTFEELTAWMEANPQQFAINDPNGGGSGPAFVGATIRNFAGENDYHDEELDEAKTADWELAWEWFEAQADNYVITSSNADSLTRLNDGEFLLAPAWEDHLAGLQKEGAISADIGFYIPEFGMNGGANAITIPANAQNKAAALVFITWLTSAETQSQFNVTFGSSPKHPDASDEFALVPNAQRAFATRWFSSPYNELSNQTFIDRIMMGQ